MKKLLLASVCFVIGAIGCGQVLLAVDRIGQLGPHGVGILFAGMIASLTLWGVAFLLFLRWRDQHAPPNPPRGSVFYKPAQRARAKLSVRQLDTLQPGAVYQVLQPFTDYYQNHFVPGMRMTFQRSNYLPYEGGHTLHFTPTPIYLQDEVNGEIVSHLERYLGLVSQPAASAPQPPLRSWRRDYTPDEFAILELTEDSVRFSLVSRTQYTVSWSYAEVLAGALEIRVRGDFDAATLAEVKSAVQARVDARS